MTTREGDVAEEESRAGGANGVGDPSTANAASGANAADEKPPRRRKKGRLLRIFGILCLLGALAVGGRMAWEMWGTGLYTARAQTDLRERLAPKLNTKTPEDAERTPPVHLPGDAIAELIIPRIDLDVIVVEGTGTESLKKGPGHYTKEEFPNRQTAYPWEDQGRVGIAGHRTTYGHPFYHLDRLRPGDVITLKTEYGTFEYRVTKTSIVDQEDGGPFLDQTRKPTLVLTTCNPIRSAEQRLVVEADRLTDATK